MRNKDIAIASIVTASIAGAVAARSVAAQQPANPRQQPGQRPPSGSNSRKSGSPNFTSHRSTTYGQQTLEPKHVSLTRYYANGNITLTVLLRTEYGTP